MLKFKEEIYSIAVHVSRNYYVFSCIHFVTMFLNTHFCETLLEHDLFYRLYNCLLEFQIHIFV